MKDIRNESTSDNLDSIAQTNIPSFTNTASYVVMPLQSPTNGAYHPISTACYGAPDCGSVSYSAAYGTVGLPNTRGDRRIHRSSMVCWLQTGLILLMLKQKSKVSVKIKITRTIPLSLSLLVWVCFLIGIWLTIFPLKGHQNTSIRNGPVPSISCPVHVCITCTLTCLYDKRMTNNHVTLVLLCCTAVLCSDVEILITTEKCSC